MSTSGVCQAEDSPSDAMDSPSGKEAKRPEQVVVVDEFRRNGIIMVSVSLRVLHSSQCLGQLQISLNSVKPCSYYANFFRPLRFTNNQKVEFEFTIC